MKSCCSFAILYPVNTLELADLGSEFDLFLDRAEPDLDANVVDGFHPPLPVSVGPRPRLVWGWRIVRRALSLGIDHLPIREIGGSGVSPLMLALRLEARTGDYSWKEQAAVVALAETLSPAMSSAAKSRISAAVRGDGALFSQVSTYKDLTATVRGLVDIGLINLKTATRIEVIPATFIESQMERLGTLSFSSRRQFLENLATLLRLARHDTSPRVNAPTRDVLSTLGDGAQSKQIAEREIISSAESLLLDDQPDASFRRLRYPILTGLEDRFEAVSAKALGGAPIRVRPPKDLEGDEISVSFSIASKQDLLTRIEQLSAFGRGCDELFDLL